MIFLHPSDTGKYMLLYRFLKLLFVTPVPVEA